MGVGVYASASASLPILPGKTISYVAVHTPDNLSDSATESILLVGTHAPNLQESKKPKTHVSAQRATVGDTNAFAVPFFSQFKDISEVKWRKVGCGIASMAMLIDYYKPGEVSVDTLLDEGLSAGAYLSDDGWTHSGLANLAKDHGLSGTTHDLSANTADKAFTQLQRAIKTGPVMVSVHYTFEPSNPIPHLVVVSGIDGDTVHYNDPADKSGDKTISAKKFKLAWKKRYIEVRPTA